jgi:insulysin
MILPKNENRIFEKMVLDNGIKTVFVEDKLLERTIISVAVKVGSLANPKEYMGLAHFLEHMLFLGSKKYPSETHFENAVKKYGGSSNAFTDHFETVYYFSAFNDGVEDLMDIFSRFFIDPLFKEDSVKREIKAINSEHQKNINSDNWREYQLYKNLAKEDSPYNTFPTGNIQSLSKKDVRAKMIEFWETYYTASNIGVCIISNMTISKQKSLIQKTFGKIEKKVGSKFTLPKPLYDIKDVAYQMIPLADIQHLNYYWEIPIDKKFKRNKLFIILGDILVKNDKNSFLNYLKVNGLVDNIFCNVHESDGIFEINIHLTKTGLDKLELIDGLLKYELDRIFKYDWTKITAYYKKLYKINFENASKIEALPLANKLCINIHKYGLDDVYVGDSLVMEEEQNPIELIKPYFFGESSNFKILLLKSPLKNQIVDKYYGTKYGLIENINSKMVPFTTKLNLDNPFLDMKPELLYNVDNDKPILIREKTWYGGSSKFNEPTIEGSLILGNQKFFSSERNTLLTGLMDRCLSFYLAQELYNILTLNYHVEIVPKSLYNCVIITYKCPNDPIKFNQFVNKTIYLIKNSEIPKRVIQSKIENLRKDLMNISKMNPWEYSNYYYRVINQSNEYSQEKLLTELNNINESDVTNFINSLFDNCNLTMFFFGNLNQDQVPQNDLFNKLIFNPNSDFAKVLFSKNVSIKHPNKNEKNNCVNYQFYTGPFTPIKWLHLFVTYLILEHKFYDELRTKKQLGYLVNLSISNLGDNYYLVQKIQSNKSCKEICIEIDKFNDTILDIINNSNLNELKKSALNQLKEKDNSIKDCYTRFFNEIVTRKFLFNRKKIISLQLKNITKDSLINFAKEYILENEYKSILNVNGN